MGDNQSMPKIASHYDKGRQIKLQEISHFQLTNDNLEDFIGYYGFTHAN